MPKSGRISSGYAAIRVASCWRWRKPARHPQKILLADFERSFTTKATGTGLGFAVGKRIVQGHGGDQRGKPHRLRNPGSDPAAGRPSHSESD